MFNNLIHCSTTKYMANFLFFFILGSRIFSVFLFFSFVSITFTCKLVRIYHLTSLVSILFFKNSTIFISITLFWYSTIWRFCNISTFISRTSMIYFSSISNWYMFIRWIVVRSLIVTFLNLNIFYYHRVKIILSSPSPYFI